MKIRTLLAASLLGTTALAQQNTPPVKNRIVFDSPTPTPQPTPPPLPIVEDKPEPQTAQQQTQGIETPPTPAPTAQPTPTPTPVPQPNADRPPMPLTETGMEPEVSMQETQGIAPLPAQPSTPAQAAAQPLLGTGPGYTPTGSVTINLINKLVERGILTRQEADDMIRQSEAEAMAVRAQSQSEMVAIAEAAAVQVAASAPAETQAPATAEDIRVTHIPAPVRQQLKEEIKLELATDRTSRQIAEALDLPAWVGKTKPRFDLRFRYAGTFFPAGNDATGAFPNFNAINTGLPYDTTGTQFAPQLNSSEDRNQYLLRARFALDFDMGENFTSGLRIATGNNNNPVSTNQGMGYPGGQTGQGGQFSKYAIWLDRAFLQYDNEFFGALGATAWVGRFDNPFFSTRLVWDDDLGFDGTALTLKADVTETFQPYLTGGAFVVYNTDFNFSTNQPQKFPSYDKYLFAAQTGFEWELAGDWTWKTGAALYWFHNIEGQLSTPFTPTTINDSGNTDNSRPSFAQKGNTYMALRDIVPDASNDYGATNQWQYYGLATKFTELALTSEISYDGFEPVRISLVGEFVQNLAYNKDDIEAVAVNNRGPADTTELMDLGAYEGDQYGWYADLRVGTPGLEKRGDWLLYAGYRWIGSDAVVDGFNDSDFGWGGTNMQGFTVGGFYSLSQNVYLGLRWMGSDSIAGPQLNGNIFYAEINSKF
ncbi:MAG: putative porin [Verrucomicrobia bacterium]|nr:putative porin [Verrucomicrobiota bacterium]